MTRANLGSRDQQEISVQGIPGVEFSDRLNAAVIELGKLPAVTPSGFGDRHRRQRGQIERMLGIELNGREIFDLAVFDAGIIQHDGKVDFDLLASAFGSDRRDPRPAELAAAFGHCGFNGEKPLLCAENALGVPEEQTGRNGDLGLALTDGERKDIRKYTDRFASFALDLHMFKGRRRQTLRPAAPANFGRSFLEARRAGGAVGVGEETQLFPFFKPDLRDGVELQLEYSAAVDRLVEIGIKLIGFQADISDAAILFRLIDQHAEGQTLPEKGRAAPLSRFTAQFQFRAAFDKGFASDRLAVIA